jgi:hypothetical protein
VNYCRICEQDFASVEAFDYHLPPAHLSPREARMVHADATELRAWGLAIDARGRWTMRESGKTLADAQRRSVKPRGALWLERLTEAGLP